VNQAVEGMRATPLEVQSAAQDAASASRGAGVIDLIAEIAAASQEQTTGIDQVTQSNAARTEELSSTAGATPVQEGNGHTNGQAHGHGSVLYITLAIAPRRRSSTRS
jgi:hypothetical protein